MLRWPLFACLAAALLFTADGQAAEKQIPGWVEKALVNPGNMLLDAKVDTGADNTSLDARNVTVAHVDGRNILRFEVDDRRGRSVMLERQQVGIEVVPRHRAEGEERPLIIMEICLGPECRETLVNLADRSRKKFPLLIGRSFMLDRIIVDPAAQYTVEPIRQPAAEK